MMLHDLVLQQRPARVPSVGDDDAQNWRCRWAGSPKFGARNQKVFAARPALLPYATNRSSLVAASSVTFVSTMVSKQVSHFQQRQRTDGRPLQII